MNMETADGKKFQNVDTAKMTEILKSLDKQNDFAILSSGDDYLQCAYSIKGFSLEYQNGSGHYEWNSGRTSGTETEEIFIHYLNNNGGIQDPSDWGKSGTDYGQQGTGYSSGSSGSVVDQIKNGAKNEIRKAVNRKTSGALRNVLNKFLN